MEGWLLVLGYLCAAFVLSRVYLYFLSKKNAGSFVAANILSFGTLGVMFFIINRNEFEEGAILIALVHASISQVIVMFYDMYRKTKI